MKKLVIAHAMDTYGGQSETFLWQYLRRFENTFPVIIAGSLQNLNQFPLPNGKIFAFSLSRWTWPWIMDNFYRRLMNRKFGLKEQIVNKEQIKIIHAHFGFVGCNYLDISNALGVPMITSFYGYDLYREDMLDRYHRAYDRLFSQGAHFLVEGPCMREQLISLGCPKEKISIQRIALNLSNYKWKKRFWNGERPVRILFVGRFVEKKGLEYALRALAKLRQDYSFEFRIIGRGELEKSLRLLADKLDFTNEIVWLGIQPHIKVIEELHRCDLLMQPSVTAKNGDSEGGAPTIILEAQACGVPVISTNHADIPYITRPKESALLSPERDFVALMNNTRHLFDNKEFWYQMSEKGRQHVEKYHDSNKEVKTLECLYNTILSESC